MSGQAGSLCARPLGWTSAGTEVFILRGFCRRKDAKLSAIRVSQHILILLERRPTFSSTGSWERIDAYNESRI